MANTVDRRLDKTDENSVYFETANLERPQTKDSGEVRLIIPAKGKPWVGWLDSEEAIKVLVEMPEIGCLILRPWEPYGEELVGHIRNIDFSSILSSKERNLATAAGALFLPSTIQTPKKSARLKFYRVMEHHLDIEPPKTPELHILFTTDRIEIWNESYLFKIRQIISEELKKQFPWVGR